MVQPTKYEIIEGQLRQASTSQEKRDLIKRIDRLYGQTLLQARRSHSDAGRFARLVVTTELAMQEAEARVTKRILKDLRGIGVEADLARHKPDDAVFLVSSPHYIGRRMRVMRQHWGDDSVTVGRTDDSLTLRYVDQNGVQKEIGVADLEEYNNLDINSFGPSEARSNELRPVFRKNGQIVYSVGKFREEKHKFAPFGEVRGEFHNADKYEWARPGKTIQAQKIPITKEEFHRIKALIEQDMKNGVSFNFIGSDCADWSLSILQRAEILDVPLNEVRTQLTYLMMPPLLKRLTGWMEKRTPVLMGVAKLITKLNIVLILFRGFLLSFLGGWTSHTEKKPYFSALTDPMFRKGRVTHPLLVRQWIDRWSKKNQRMGERGYYIAVTTSCTDTKAPQLTGSHAWLRLYEPEAV